MGTLVTGIGQLVGGLAGGIAKGAGATSNFQAQLDPVTLAQQQAFSDILQQQAMGQGPNLAQEQFNIANQQNVSNAAALAAAQRGANPALAARQAQQAQAQMGSQAAGQSALMRAQQQLSAQSLYGQQLQERQRQALDVQGVNAQTAAQNAAARAGVAGGLLSGAGAAAAGAAGGMYNGGTVGYANGGQVQSSVSRFLLNDNTGVVPGEPVVPGDNPINDIVNVNLSPGEIVIPNSIARAPNAPEKAKEFVEQEIEKTPAQIRREQMLDALTPESSIDKFNKQKNFRNTQTPAPLALPTDNQPLPQLPQDQQMQAVPQPAPQAPIGQQVPVGQQDQFGYGAQQAALMGGLGKQKAGLQQEAIATGQLGQRQADILEQQNRDVAQRQITFEQNIAELNQKRQQFMEDIQKEKINPNNYFSNLSTAGKISTIIGLVLGGIGGGMTGRGGNAALDTLNNLIARDIDAQRAEMDKKKNLLAANMEDMKSLKDAELMTRTMMNDAVANQLKMEAAKSQDPISKARAMSAIGTLEAQNSQILGNLAMKRAMVGGAQAGKVAPEKLINIIVPQQDQKAAREELSKVNAFKGATREIADTFEQAKDIGGIEGNIPLTAKKTRMETIGAKLYGTARQQMKGQGSLSDQEVEQGVQPFIPVATDTVAQLEEKKKGFIDFLKNGIQGGFPVLKSYNIPIDLGTPGLTTQEQKLLNFAKANPNDPNSQKIIQRLGK